MNTQLPYPMQPHGMPLPYTLPRTGPYSPYVYQAPPMPTTYNPYATLHHYQPQGNICVIDYNKYLNNIIYIVSCFFKCF